MAARSTWDGLTLVYKYKCMGHAQLSPEALEQQQLALDLRRNLVAVDRHFDERWQAVWARHPDVAVAQAEVDKFGTQLDELYDQARKERAEDRTTTPRKSTAATIKAVKEQLRMARTQLKEVKADALVVVKPLLTKLDEKHRQDEKLTRQEAVTAGLFWATANAVLDDHRVARQAVLRARREGKAAERRMPRWDSPSTLSTQVMSGAGKPRRSPQLLASGEGPWRNVFQIRPWRPEQEWPKGRGSHEAPDGRRLAGGTHRLGEVIIRVAGKDKPPLKLPIVMHRPIPDEADITDVQVTRRWLADQQILTVAITVRLPKPPPKTTGDVVAVRFGWAGVGDGWVRVATVATATGPLPLPKDNRKQLTKMVRISDTTTEILAMPEWKKVLDRSDRIRGYRDSNLDEIKKKVVKILEDDPKLVAHLTEVLQREKLEVGKWRAARRMVRLWQVWPDDHPFKKELDEWRKRDKHLWQFEVHERNQVITRRRYLYQNVASWLCEHARQLVLSDVDIAELTQKPKAGAADSAQAQQARVNRQWAAPGDLRELIRNAAIRRGVDVVEAVTEHGTNTLKPKDTVNGR